MATQSVPAEVMLKHPGASEDAARKLRGLGLDVVSVGNFSVSIQGTPRQFEELFGATLVPVEDDPAPARDFGPLGGTPGFRADRPLRPPRDLEDIVDSIELQQPPRLMY